jgi:carboxypeptidase family protein
MPKTAPEPFPLSLEELKRGGDRAMADSAETVQVTREILAERESCANGLTRPTKTKIRSPLIASRGNPMLLRTVLGGILAVSGLSASQEGAGFFGRVSEGTVPVAGAIVTISNRGFVKSVTTNGNGRFALEPIPAGRYDLRTSVSGYAVFECSVIVHSDDSHRNWIDVTHHQNRTT